MFLTTTDYSSHQSAIDLQILTLDSNIRVRNFAENAAVEMMKTHLRMRFLVDELFIDVWEYDEDQTYNAGDHVEHDGSIYYAETASTGITPVDTAAEWNLGDLRRPELVMMAVDMTIYHLFAKIASRQTPQDVSERYGDALSWLKDVSRGKLAPEYPEIGTSAPSNVMRWGSQTKLNQRY